MMYKNIQTHDCFNCYKCPSNVNILDVCYILLYTNKNHIIKCPALLRAQADCVCCNILDGVPVPLWVCSLHWSWRGKGFKVMQHCQQWVVIPIYLHLCGTNPSVHSQTIEVNPRLVHRTTVACHNRLSKEALTGYQSQNKERATVL